MASTGASFLPATRPHSPTRSSSCCATTTLRLRLGEAGRRTVVDRFSIDAQVRAIEAVYDEELARAGVLLDGDRGPAPRPNQRGALELPP